jgi:plastocyanin
MPRRHAAIVVPLALATVALLAPGRATAAKFFGTVGPGMTITLERANGTKVRRIQAGTHTFVIRDRSVNHNFHLLGPGIDRKTSVAFTGRQRWRITLGVGTHRYRCDPHRAMMRGRFTVY